MSTIVHTPGKAPASSGISPRTCLNLSGGILLLVGLLAITAPVVSSLAIELVVGWMLVLGGIGRMIHTFQERHEKGFWFSLLFSVLTLGTGVVMLVYPLSGLLALGWLVGFYFIMSGIVTMSWSFTLKPAKGWGWLLTQGILNLVLGFLVLSGWPLTAAWVLGLFVGIDLIFAAFSMFAFAQTLPRRA